MMAMMTQKWWFNHHRREQQPKILFSRSDVERKRRRRRRCVLVVVKSLVGTTPHRRGHFGSGRFDFRQPCSSYPYPFFINFFTSMMRSDPGPVPTEQEEEHALLVVREFRGDPAERGPGGHSSLWLLVIAVFLVLAAGNCFGAVWKHKEPAEVAQRAVVSKTATTGDATADAKKDAISTGSEGAAEAISSSVTLAVSGKGVFETPKNRKATGDLLKACGSTCLAVTGILAVETGGAAVPAVAACVPLILAGSANSAYDDTLEVSTASATTGGKAMMNMMNARFDKLSEEDRQGV